MSKAFLQNPLSFPSPEREKKERRRGEEERQDTESVGEKKEIVRRERE